MGLLPRVVVLYVAVVTGCDTAPRSEADAGRPDAGRGDWRECDPLVPSACGFPFPNDVYTVADPDSPTGLHLHFLGAAVPDRTRTLAPFEALDGFSPAS